MKVFGHIISIVSLLGLLSMQVFAVDPQTFYINVEPNPLKLSEPADMTIKAVQSDGSVVTDYIGTVIMDFDGYPDINTYDMPNNGIYQFTAEDQGSKTFSKGLTIKKSGNYTLKVVSSDNDAIVGSLVLVVGSGSNNQSTGSQLIEIISPTGSGVVIEASAINIIGKSDTKKAPLQFFVDDNKAETEGETDENGNFSVYLTSVTPGLHTIMVKMVDYQGNVIGTSNPVTIDYKAPALDQYLESFTVTPSGKINAGDTVVIDAQVDGVVRSVELRIGDMGLYPMERKDDGTFTKSLVVDAVGIQKIDATLIFEGGQRTVYPDRATLDVSRVNGVGIVKLVNDIADPQKVTVSWNPIGTPSSYMVRYGQSKDNLSSELKTSNSSITVSQLEVGKEYFFQVYALDSSGAVSGQGSNIASLLIKGQNAAGDPSGTSVNCTVVGIKVKTQKINNEYFLVWDPVPGATKYTVYRSEFMVNSVDQMQKIGDTEITQFSYPFDATAKQDQYAYYAVTANCSDGNSLQIDNIKKIHVGPISDMITLLLICLFCYSIYRLYRFS